MNYAFFIIPVVAIVISSIRQVNQYQKGLIYLGQIYFHYGTGLEIVWPIFQSCQKVDVRIKAVDVPDQNAITRDNVTVKVNAVIYYKVSNAEKAIIEVEDFRYAISQYAQTTMRILWEKLLWMNSFPAGIKLRTESEKSWIRKQTLGAESSKC